MSLSDRAIAARSRANWITLVGWVSLRQGLTWAGVVSILIILLTSLTQISKREAHYTVSHMRASNSVSMGQPNAPFKITDEYGRAHVISAFAVQTHPAIRGIADDTKTRFKRYLLFAAVGGLVAFCLGFWSVVNGARR